MTVEYFTPSKEDVEQAPEHLEMLRLYMIYNDTGHLIGHDFESHYTQEEKDAIRAQLEPISIEFTSLMDFSESAHARDLARKIIARGKPEDSNAAVISELALPCQPIPPTFNPNFGVMKGGPKDFTPVAALSVLPDAQIKPSYHVKEVKIINGQKVTFYGQDLSKDKK